MSENNNVLMLPSVEIIEEEASAWLVVFGRESVSDQEKADFEHWLERSERHRITFNELAMLWGEMAVLKELDDIAESSAEFIDARSPLWQRKGLMSLAASFFVAVFISGVFYFNNGYGLNQQASYVTAMGEQRSIHLSDGTIIQLNTNSQIEVRYSKTVRSIYLRQGEGFFEVAKNKSRPFKVYAGEGVVRAVGTAFSVRLMAEQEVEVIVEEGRVALSRQALDSIVSLIESPPSNESQDRPPIAELTAGQSAVFAQKIQTLEHMPATEINRKLAWRQGMLAYAGDPLSSVVDDVSRYTNIKIEITDPALRGMQVAGHFRVGEVEALFDSLELTFGLRVERVNDSYVKLYSAQEVKK